MGFNLTADMLLPSGCEFDLSCCGAVMRLGDRHNHHLGKAELLVDSLPENEDDLLTIIYLLYTYSQLHPHLKAMFDKIGS